MFKVLLIGKQTEDRLKIVDALRAQRFICDHIPADGNAEEKIADRAPDIVIVAAENSVDVSPIIHTIKELRRERPIPVLALMTKESLKHSKIPLKVEDFAIESCETGEITLRIEKILKDTYAVEGKDVIRSGDLMIDLLRREVTIEGNPLSLTFKEYELLQFLAANRGRVFTRESLLNKIWGHDYYGGDRTVDVHIRRLRAKVEWGRHSFIETVRGVGYRFKESS